MKIIVYAICKNEEKFVQGWVDTMAEADEIVVLDTGSTDGTVEKLQALGVRVTQEVITPWRFDVARNRSLELVDEDADICICTDLDERFQPGWRKALERAWIPGSQQARYRYTWNFNPDGSEGVVFWIEKAHARKGFRWTHPVHEVLEYFGEKPYRQVKVVGMQLDHHADPGKSRGQYLPLLELSVAECPEDDRNMHYLGREYMFHGQWDKCIETLMRHLSMPTARWADERSASMRFIARSLQAKGQTDQARDWYLRAIAEAPHLREPYVELAQLLYTQKRWEGVVYMAECALAMTVRPDTYICEASAWGSLPYDLASLGYYYTGQYEKALERARLAVEAAPQDERLQGNLHLIEKKISG